MCICTYPPNKKISREPSQLLFLFSQPQRCGWCQRRRSTCRPTGPWGCGAGVQLRDRRLSFATRMKWVCRCSTGVAYNWSCARRADRTPDRQQHTSDVGRCKSSLGSTKAPSHLVTYPHQLTLRSSQLASPQGSSLNRLLAWRAWLLGVSCGLRLQDALEAEGAISLRLGTAPGTAFARPASGSLALLISLLLSPSSPS